MWLAPPCDCNCERANLPATTEWDDYQCSTDLLFEKADRIGNRGIFMYMQASDDTFDSYNGYQCMLTKYVLVTHDMARACRPPLRHSY